MKHIIRYITLFILSAFAIVTLFMSSSVIFDWFGIREKQGHYVSFVVWANWLCGFIYLCSVYGLLKSKPWTTKLLGFSAFILIVTFLRLLIYINSGGIYETKTLYALLFRVSVTLLFFFIAYRSIPKIQK